MNWDDAKARCASLGMRLPTLAEFKAAYDSGVTKSWNEQYGYWTSDVKSYARAYEFDIANGSSGSYHNGFNFNVRCIRKKEPQKPSGATGNWSAYQGEMNWYDAKAKCESLGMRLPTLAEFNAAYDSGVTKSWNDLSAYWTSDVFSDFRAYFFNIDGGYSNHYRKDVGSFYVRCIR